MQEAPPWKAALCMAWSSTALGVPRSARERLDCQDPGVNPVWSKISNTLKRLGFQSHNFLAQLLSETSRACTIRVRRSSLGRLGNDLGSHAGLHHRNRRPGTSTEERISGRREPDPESPNQRPSRRLSTEFSQLRIQLVFNTIRQGGPLTRPAIPMLGSIFRRTGTRTAPGVTVCHGT